MPDIAIGRHAVAIDEHRAFFRTNLWVPIANPDEAGPKDLKQVWFPGVHCDVGGGYPEPESGLSKIALQWMIEEARRAGLLLDDEPPFGRVIAQASHDKEEILIGEIDLKLQEDTRRNWPFLRDRRVDAYNGITSRFID